MTGPQEHFAAPLAGLTTLRLGGPARRLVEPTRDEIVEAVAVAVAVAAADAAGELLP